MRKRKQPIAYYFTDGGMKHSDLTHILKQLITHLHNIGLRVVAIVISFSLLLRFANKVGILYVCDQLSTH